MAEMIDGRVVAKTTLQSLRPRIAALPRAPGIAVVRVGGSGQQGLRWPEDGARGATGFRHEERHLPEHTTQEQLESVVDELNADDGIDGILVQLPLPSGLDSTAILDKSIPPKMWMGFTPIMWTPLPGASTVRPVHAIWRDASSRAERRDPRG